MMKRFALLFAFATVAFVVTYTWASQDKEVAAGHKACCTPGTPGACCNRDAKLGECCKDQDCCKDDANHCCTVAAQAKISHACCTPGEAGACCAKDAMFGECCKGKDCCSGKDCCEHAADHVAKACCTPGTPGACCAKDAKFGECCKGKDCCKEADHCCHSAAERSAELVGAAASL